ncbi:hypothetical protein MtrunA17_Chr5g0408791 [Medicago truncatula]|uniref:Uncharacterized protein n=1 Tax=Medicago truncatula TaxID=3880 RepID=G7K5E3_MEDTR|nr:hypothetical protein MTR_5g026130 [Medicago truncatula]RHN54611.1 hypothetical protein MtrunA17_Chr5g0408791 [Medicago truncatula]
MEARPSVVKRNMITRSISYQDSHTQEIEPLSLVDSMNEKTFRELIRRTSMITLLLVWHEEEGRKENDDAGREGEKLNWGYLLLCCCHEEGKKYLKKIDEDLRKKKKREDDGK